MDGQMDDRQRDPYVAHYFTGATKKHIIMSLDWTCVLPAKPVCQSVDTMRIVTIVNV